jgi:hypothetical protein
MAALDPHSISISEGAAAFIREVGWVTLTVIITILVGIVVNALQPTLFGLQPSYILLGFMVITSGIMTYLGRKRMRRVLSE